MEPHPWIDRIWFGAFTALSAFAALYPVSLLRALNLWPPQRTARSPRRAVLPVYRSVRRNRGTTRPYYRLVPLAAAVVGQDRTVRSVAEFSAGLSFGVRSASPAHPGLLRPRSQLSRPPWAAPVMVLDWCCPRSIGCFEAVKQVLTHRSRLYGHYGPPRPRSRVQVP
jgi:hypothetical protein